MTLGTILLLCAAAFVYAALVPARWRGWALLIVSVIAVYALQPALPIRYSAFVLPTTMLVLIVASWWLTRPAPEAAASVGATQVTEGYTSPLQHQTISEIADTHRTLPFRLTRDDLVTLITIAALVIGVSLLRFIDADYRLVASTPPPPLSVIGALASIALVGAVAVIVAPRLAPDTRRAALHKRLLTAMIGLIVAVFVVFKAQPLATELSRALRLQAGQDTSLATFLDLGWVGFSYVAFRLIHTLRDRQTGILPPLSLREYVTYVIFFPAFTAGPIDRAERFVEDYRALPALRGLDANRIGLGLTRIFTGLLKKFVIADTLALGLALNPVNAGQVESALGMWVLLYGYSLRLFFDFSGYTDIAIGIGILYGVALPENFNRPYLKTTLTSFWQSWHMTLSSWARFYVFSPLSRALLMRKPKPSPTLIVLVTQVTTMIVIGLWHGVTLNFLIWGIWHGVGLFAHKQWSDRTRKWYRGLSEKPAQKRAWTAFSWLLTFHYVVLGWVWFALPDVGQSLRAFGMLLGGGV